MGLIFGEMKSRILFDLKGLTMLLFVVEKKMLIKEIKEIF